MSNSQLDYETIQRRADVRIRKRIEFYKHLGVYVIVNVCVWLFFAAVSFVTKDLGALIPAILTTLGWGIGLAIHGLVNYLDTVNIEAMRDREIKREIQREMEIRGMSEQELFEKPKRDRVARLSDDGELTYDDEQSPNRSQSKRNRH